MPFRSFVELLDVVQSSFSQHENGLVGFNGFLRLFAAEVSLGPVHSAPPCQRRDTKGCFALRRN